MVHIPKWLILIKLGLTIGIIRIFINGHYKETGVKLVPELLMVIIFITQTILIGTGLILLINKIKKKMCREPLFVLTLP